MAKVIFGLVAVTVRTACFISFKKWLSIQLAIKRFGTPTFKYPAVSVSLVEFLNQIRNFCGPIISARASLMVLIWAVFPFAIFCKWVPVAAVRGLSSVIVLCIIILPLLRVSIFFIINQSGKLAIIEQRKKQINCILGNFFSTW
jgi:hypothetical protein